jgi:hypothetical protein
VTQQTYSKLRDSLIPPELIVAIRSDPEVKEAVKDGFDKIEKSLSNSIDGLLKTADAKTREMISGLKIKDDFDTRSNLLYNCAHYAKAFGDARTLYSKVTEDTLARVNEIQTYLSLTTALFGAFAKLNGNKIDLETVIPATRIDQVYPEDAARTLMKEVVTLQQSYENKFDTYSDFKPAADLSLYLAVAKNIVAFSVKDTDIDA